MSLITGNLKEIIGVATDGLIKFRAAISPVWSGTALIVPDEVSARANPTGFFSQVLAKGDYEVTVPARNGQIAKFTINVLDDDLTYSWEQRVTSAIPSPSAPIGGAQPTASPSTLGLVRVDDAAASPVASTGFVQCATVVALRAIVAGSWSKRAWLTAAEAHAAREWWYDVTSLAVDDDGLSVVRATNVDVGVAGRWLAW